MLNLLLQTQEKLLCKIISVIPLLFMFPISYNNLIRRKLLHVPLWFLILINIIFSACNNTNYSEQDIKRLQVFRQSKDNYFKTSPASPIPDFQKEYFNGLNYFPPNGNFKIKAQFIKQDSIDTTAKLKIAGKILFKFNDTTYSLIAYYDNDSTLFIPFKDLTNGNETYGGGRYLNLPLPKNSSTLVIDFNYAYNPYCAYNPNYVCVLPPEQNYLNFRVEAGEKKLFEELK